MALPQTIDPASLNLSGTPAIATAPTTTTSVGATGMPNARVEDVNRPVNPALGALFGGLLGYATGQNLGSGATGLTPINRPQTGTGSGSGSGGGSGGGGGTRPSGGTGNIGSVNNVKVPSTIPISEAQNWLNTNYGMTNGKPNYVVSGTNMSTGEVIGLPNDTIGGTNLGTNTGNFGFEAGTGSGGTTGGTTQTGNQYFQDTSGNVYDADGTLIYYNPSNAISGGTMDDGGYDPNAEEDAGQFFQSDAGDIYDYAGNLVLEYGNGYYYEPDTGNYYDSNFDVVGDDFSFFEDFMGLPAFDSSMYGDLGDYFDYGNYTSGSTTYIKDGGSVKGGLATPLFKNGGSVPRFADGGTSFTDQVVANQMPQSVSTTSTPVATQTNLTNSNTSGIGAGNILDSILGFAKDNPTITGAGLGALLTAALNSGAMAIPTNRGVDMTALGTLKPRTTPTGATRFVPYSQYGTPTTPYDYSQLYANLGVSPFGAGAGALSPSATPTTPTSAQPVTTTPTAPTAPTTPTGGLPTSTTPTITPPTASAPQYFQDADGNIYNANGDLVYDTTTNSTTAIAQQQAVAPSGTTQASVAPMSGLAVTTPEATASYYSYGTDINPSDVLNSKKGGAIRKFADGGMSDLAVTSLSDFTEDPVFDYSDIKFSPMGGVKYDATTGLATDVNGNTMDVSDFVGTYGTHPSNFTPDFLTDKELLYGTGSTTGNYYDGLYHPNYTGISTGLPSKETGSVPLPYERNNVSTTDTDFPVAYNNGMPTQGPAMPTQGELMPRQGSLMPTQGPAMPQQTPFSSSPTFRFSGANNPLLTGLRQGPVQQPFMLMPNGTFAPREEISTSRLYGQYAEGGSPHGNANIPVTEGHNPNVPIVQGRQDYRKGAYVQGEGDGQSDDIPAMLADGEYVIDAETVAQLGNGSNKAGAKMLDEFRENIRAHKRSAPTHKIPPKSKSPLAYLKGAK